MDREQLLFATTNLGKLQEAQGVAEQYGVTLFGCAAMSTKLRCDVPVVEESGASYETNALIKAHAYAGWSGIPTIADDSGVELAELGGLPGVFTARFGVERVVSLLGRLGRFDATMVCCAAYVEPNGRTVSVTKRLQGYLALEETTAAVSGPLPFSKLFIPLGHTQRLSELSTVGGFNSHRGQALAGLFTALSRQ